MLDGITKWLRTLGKVGELVAEVVKLLDSKTGVAVLMSTLLAFVTWAWNSLFEFLSNPRIQVSIGAFLAALWTFVALRLLWTARQTLRTTTEPEYQYCLNPEGFQLAIDPANDDAALQIGFSFRNVSHHPIRVRVEEFRLIIDDRTCPDPDTKMELVIPRISARGIRSGVFKKDVLKKVNTGTLEVIVFYGPPAGAFVRRYRYKTKLHFAFPQDSQGKIMAAGIMEERIVEEDGPLPL